MTQCVVCGELFHRVDTDGRDGPLSQMACIECLITKGAALLMRNASAPWNIGKKIQAGWLVLKPEK